MNNENKEFFVSDVEAEELTLEEKKPSTSKVLYEDISKRGKNTKHFRLQNGNFMAVMYDRPVHKLDPDTGKYVDIASEVQETDTDYEAVMDHFKVRLPKTEGKDRFVTVEKDGREVSWKFIPRSASRRKKSAAAFSRRPKQSPWDIGDHPSVKYEKADTNTDLQYDVADDGVKESIVLTKDLGCKTFTFQMKFKGLVPMLSEDNKTVFLVRDDEDLGAELPEMQIPPAFMEDANEAFCDDIHYEIRKTDEGTFLDLVLDTDWLSDPERSYPVVIDPRVEISYYSNNGLQMVELCSDGSKVIATNTNTGRRVGVDSAGVAHRIYLNFNLPELADGFKITKAGLLLHQKSYASYGNIQDYEIDSVQLNGLTLGGSSFTWENAKNLPIHDTIDMLSGYYRRAATEIEIDMTKTMTHWYANTTTPHCIMIKKTSEEPCCCNNNCFPTYLDFYSLYGTYSYRPKLYVEYTNNDMYADHQKYHTFENGRAGTGSVNLFNGSFLFAHSDIALKSAKLPLSVSHLYRPDFDEVKYGLGWKLSVEQTVDIMQKHGVYAVYTDAQGKRHYFMEDSDGSIKDDAGLGLTFTHECECYCGCETKYSIADEQGNKMLFNENGKLIQLTDAHGNISYLSYTNGNLTKVVDGNGNAATLTYQNGKLYQIIDADGDALTFGYDGDLLKNITYPSSDGDSRVTTFDYININNSSKLIKVTDISGIVYEIGYDTEGRVVNLLCSGNVNVSNSGATSADNTLFGDEIVIDYRGSSTAVMNNRTKIKNVYKFDANGRVLSTYQDLTEVVDSASKSETTVTEIFDYESIMNVDETSKMGKYRSLSVSLNNDASNETNLLQNGLFTNTTGTLIPTGWSVSGATSGASGVSAENYLNGKKSYYFGANNTKTNKHLSQTVSLCNCNLSGNILVASAWAKASEQVLGSADSSTAKFRLCLKVTYEGGEVEEYFENYDTEYHGWQYAAIPFVFNKDCCPIEVTVKLDYTSNKGTCYFTNARLVSVEGSITTNTYRKNDGYVTSVCVFDEEQDIKLISTKKNSLVTTAAYQNANSDVVYSVITDKNGRKFENFFKYDNKHNLVKQQDYRGVVSEMTYNSYGKELTRKTYHKNSPNAYMYSEYAYDNAQFLKSERDPRYSYDGGALVKQYTYDTVRGLLKQETDLNGQTYQHTYDSKTDEMEALTSTEDSVTLQNDFSYKRGYLTQVGHNGFTYGFDFDALGRSSSVSIAGNSLFDKVYEEDNVSESVTTTYAGGEETRVTSDIFGHATKRTYKGKNEETHSDISSAEYDHAGRLEKYVDNESGICYNYKYNDHGQVIEIKETDLNGVLLRTNTFAYDSKKRLAATTYGAVGQTYRPIYEKNASGHEYPDDVVVGIKLDGKFTDQTIKDGLGRVATRTLTVENSPLLTENYNYLKTSLASGKTIETAIIAGTTGQIGSTSANTAYTYDISGNIETVTVDSVLVAKYHYDKWNRIVREDNYKFGKTYTWEYDIGGNITEKRTYALCTGDAVSGEYTSDNYEYATSGWKDQLTSFNGEVCEYDDLGNPTTYRGKTLNWTKVRRLAKFGDVEFTYNANGLRTSKSANGVTKSYLLAGSSILQEKIGSNILKYYYGNGGIIGFNYNDVDYFYRKNLQGDVIGIYTSSGAKVVSYVYDAWGNHKIYDANGNEVISTTHIGYINPIRYRGYYFDVETGLYYLKTRYYDPQIGRFISSDDVDYLMSEQIMGLNLYAYCCNNPVMGYDPTGTLNWKNIFKAAAVVVAVTAVVALTVATAGAAAVAAGAVSATVATAATTGAVVGGLVAGTSEIVSQCVTVGSDNLDMNAIAIETFGGSVHGAIDGVASTVASVGVRLGCKAGKVVLGGVQAALHSANDGDTATEMVGDVAKSMAGGIALQGALIGLDGITGKLSTSVLESQLLDGAMQYGAKQMALTGAIRIGANIWRNKDKILNAFFKE